MTSDRVCVYRRSFDCLLRVEDTYDLGGELGRGAFSVVMRGKHRDTRDNVRTCTPVLLCDSTRLNILLLRDVVNE